MKEGCQVKKRVKALLATGLALSAFTLVQNSEEALAQESSLSEVDLLSNSVRRSVTRHYSAGSYYPDDSIPGLNPIPQTIRVTERINGQMYAGTLSLSQYYRNSSSQYVAEYVGNLVPDNTGPTPLSPGVLEIIEETK